VVVARSEIRAVWRVVKQVPVEMLQQWSSASSCIWTRNVIEGHYEYTVCQHSKPFVLNVPMQFFFFVSQYTSDVIVVP
jgi:hypothetical protein